MRPQTLSFYSRGLAMVFDLEAHEQGIRRFIGRRHDKTVGFAAPDGTMSGGWPSTEKPQTVPVRGEYVMACRNGDLWPADEETAKYCGVPFDPKFGGEIDMPKETPPAKSSK